MNANESSPIPEVVTTNSVASDSSSVSLLIGSPNPAKQLTAAEKLAAQKKKKQLQFNWGRGITDKDFDYEKKDDGSIIINKVRGQDFKSLKSEMLKGICSSRGITYTSKNIDTMRKDISNVVSLSEELGKIANGSTKSNVKKAPAKDSCPLYIKDTAYEATFLKLVNVIMHEKTRASYLALFDRYDKDDYDSRSPKKEAVKELTNFYMNPPDDVNALGLDLFPEMKEKFGGVEDDDPIQASEIKEEDMMRCIHHLNKLYRSDRNKKNKSGHHQPFSDYASKSFVLYYHLRLEKSGNTGLDNVAYAELAPNIFNASETSTVVTNDTAKPIKRKNGGIAQTLKKKQLKLLEQKLEQHQKNNDVGESVVERNKEITEFMSVSTRASLMDQFRKLRQDIRSAEHEEDSEDNEEYIAILKAELINVRRQLGV